MTSKRQAQIYLFVCEYAGAKGGPTPTIREIARHFKLSYSTVYQHVMGLCAADRLDREDGKLLIVGSTWNPPTDNING